MSAIHDTRVSQIERVSKPRLTLTFINMSIS